MHNKETFEYRQVEDSDYQRYKENANLLLSAISDWAGIPISEISYFEIVDFFTTTFDLEVICFNTCGGHVNYDYDFLNEEIYEVSATFAKRVSGFTVTDGNSYKIFLQKYDMINRIIFTLLHELVHIYFHCCHRPYMQIFASMDVDGHYPDEILPFEDEANVIASIVNLNDEQLYEYLDKGYSFDQIVAKHDISRSALHNRLNNYFIYDLGLNPEIAFFNFLLPYKREVFGTDAVERIQILQNASKKFLTFLPTDYL